MDFSFFSDAQASEAERSGAVRAYSELLSRMRAHPKLILALVDGEVKAGGIGIVAAADMVLASQRSTFQLSEVFLGLLPANVLPFLAERVGAHRAAYLTLSARTLSAEEAHAQGLADEVFAQDALEKETRSFLRTLLRASPYALARGKRFTREISGCTRDAACEKAQQTLLEMAARSEVRDAISSFEEGGLPPWSMRFKPGADIWIK
jgi:enoyl-CoA hydratase/carnithine racemase